MKKLSQIKKIFSKKDTVVTIENIIDSTVSVQIIKELHVKTLSDLDEKKVILKTSLSDGDKQKFILNIESKEYKIDRHFRTDDTLNSIDFFSNSLDLEFTDIIRENNKILILGNPGLGKTTELREVAIKIWKDKSDILFPIYRSLKNFTSQDTIENFININLDELGDVIFIFDGIDEIPNIQDFISKLETFILQSELGNKKYKFLISCRTNIYKNIVSNIVDFKSFFLKDLQLEQAKDFLKYKCGDIINQFEFETINSFMKNPFQLEIIADYIEVNKRLPSNTAEMWESYIDKRLTTDKKDKLVKIDLVPAIIKTISKRISLVNELMKTNIISEENLFNAVKNNSNDFLEIKKSPLMERQTELENWFFEHRNIQEYFAALALAEKEFEVIKSFICIQGTENTHPSLFNTITFLLNIIDEKSDKFSDLISMLMKNEPEVLFKADSNRIEFVKERVFQTYFHEQCIEKTLWLNTNKSFTYTEIGRFASCKANFDYLLKIILNPISHFRVRISAMEVLSEFNVEDVNVSLLETEFIKILKTATEEKNIKAHAIDCIHALKLNTYNLKLLDAIVEIFSIESNKQITRAILDLVNASKEVDIYFDFIKQEFFRENGIVPRSDDDEVSRGNGYMIRNVILKLKEPKHFLEIVTYYFKDKFNLRLDSDFAISISDKAVGFIETDETFLKSLLSQSIYKGSHFLNDDLLRKIIIDSKTQLDAADYLLANYEFNSIRSFVAKISNKDVLNLVIEHYELKEINAEEIELYRNNLNFTVANSSAMAELFDSLMREKGFVFREKLFNDEERDIYQKRNRERAQSNFDILFRRDDLITQIKEIFDKNEPVLNSELLLDIEMKWYEIHRNITHSLDTSLSVLQTIIYQNGPLDFERVSAILINSELFVFEKINSKIDSNKNSNELFTITNEQQCSITDWCITGASEIDFEKLIVLNNSNSFTLLPDFEKVRLILSFQNKFKFQLQKEFLLNCLEYYVFQDGDGEEQFGRLIELINDKEQFDARVIHNILHKQMLSFNESFHIDYALENNLTATFPKIRECFAANPKIYSGDRDFKMYIDATNDIDLLKLFTNDIDTFSCWTAIEILMERNILREMCLSKSVEYLESKKSEFIKPAIEVLFQANDKRAVTFFADYLTDGVNVSPATTILINYDALSDISIIDSLFKATYDPNLDKFAFNGSDTFLKSYIGNLSKENYQIVQEKLLEIKESLVPDAKETGLFYINLLLEVSTNSYINSMSVALDFREALQMAEILV